MHPKNGLTHHTPSALIAAVCCVATLGTLIAQAQQIEQSITLLPGWNAVWLEVEPADNSTDSVLGGLPVASAWTRAERLSSADYIQNPSEEVFNEAGWLGWFHPSRPETFVGNLFALHANRAYLIKLETNAPVTWAVVGRPSLRQPEWVPDSFNLRGLPVDPTILPTFRDFLMPSTAHYRAATGQLEAIYRLDAPANQWVPVTASEPILSGQAYWIYTRGASDYAGPLDVAVSVGDGLEFGLETEELELTWINRGAAPVYAVLHDLVSAGPSALSHYQFDSDLGGRWEGLVSPMAFLMSPGASHRLRLAVRRQDLADSQYASVLRITDGAGTCHWVPVEAQRLAASGDGLAGRAASPDVNLGGLWVGSATLDAVSEPHSGDPTAPTPVHSPISLRLIIHVDAAGQARLLKEVIQMWKEGTYRTDAQGDLEVDQPGEYVLLTDATLVPMFQGVTPRDGKAVGRRLSTVGYDFDSSQGSNDVLLTGSLGVGQTLQGTLTLPADHPRHPFKHRFHPDHDNLNARFDGPELESFDTTRQIALTFSETPPEGPPTANYGYNTLGGSYSETVLGLHHLPIRVSGVFRLTRVSTVTQLNPNPSP